MSAPSEIPSTTRIPEDMTGRPRRVVTGGISLRKTFSALRHRNFRLFFYGQLISLIGTWMTTTAQGWLVYQLTGSKALLGIVAACASAPMLVFSTWGGWAADRYSKRSVLVVTQISSMIQSLTMAALVWSGHVKPWQIILIAVIGGVTMAFDMPARQSFVIEMTSREDLMNAISLNSSVFNAARVIGPSLAGILMAKVGIAMCFFLDGISFIAVISGLLMMRLPKRKSAPSETGAIGQALEGFRYVWNHPRPLTILSLFAVVGIFGWSYSVLMPAFAHDVLHLGEQGYGMLMAASGVGALLAALTVATAGHSFPRAHWRSAASGFFPPGWRCLLSTEIFTSRSRCLRSAVSASCFISQPQTRCCKRSCPMKCADASWESGRSFSAA